jgi:hypothetical protein
MSAVKRTKLLLVPKTNPEIIYSFDVVWCVLRFLLCARIGRDGGGSERKLGRRIKHGESWQMVPPPDKNLIRCGRKRCP